VYVEVGARPGGGGAGGGGDDDREVRKTDLPLSYIF